jgi:hypothetical protein
VKGPALKRKRDAKKKLTNTSNNIQGYKKGQVSGTTMQLFRGIIANPHRTESRIHNRTSTVGEKYRRQNHKWKNEAGNEKDVRQICTLSGAATRLILLHIV